MNPYVFAVSRTNRRYSQIKPSQGDLTRAALDEVTHPDRARTDPVPTRIYTTEHDRIDERKERGTHAGAHEGHRIGLVRAPAPLRRSHARRRDREDASKENWRREPLLSCWAVGCGVPFLSLFFYIYIRAASTGLLRVFVFVWWGEILHRRGRVAASCGCAWVGACVAYTPRG